MQPSISTNSGDLHANIDKLNAYLQVTQLQIFLTELECTPDFTVNKRDFRALLTPSAREQFDDHLAWLASESQEEHFFESLSYEGKEYWNTAKFLANCAKKHGTNKYPEAERTRDFERLEERYDILSDRDKAMFREISDSELDEFCGGEVHWRPYVLQGWEPGSEKKKVKNALEHAQRSSLEKLRDVGWDLNEW